MKLNPVVAAVTQRIRERSGPGRAQYLSRLEAAATRDHNRARSAEPDERGERVVRRLEQRRGAVCDAQ